MEFTEKTLSTKRVYNGKVVFVDYDDIEFMNLFIEN